MRVNLEDRKQKRIIADYVTFLKMGNDEQSATMEVAERHFNGSYGDAEIFIERWERAKMGSRR